MKVNDIIKEIEKAKEKDYTLYKNDFSCDMTLKDFIKDLKSTKTNLYIKYDLVLDSINEEYVEDWLIEYNEGLNMFFDYVRDLGPDDIYGDEYDIIEYAKINNEIYKLDITIYPEWCGDWSVRGWVTSDEGFSVKNIEKV